MIKKIILLIICILFFTQCSKFYVNNQIAAQRNYTQSKIIKQSDYFIIIGYITCDENDEEVLVEQFIVYKDNIEKRFFIITKLKTLKENE